MNEQTAYGTDPRSGMAAGADNRLRRLYQAVRHKGDTEPPARRQRRRWWPALLVPLLLPLSALTMTSTAAHAATASLSYTVNDTDSGITYTGSGWVYSNNRGHGDYNNDVHATANDGDSFSYKFYGTGITYITEKSADEGTVNIYMDGVEQTTVNLSASTYNVPQQTAYTVSNLSSGWHTLTVVKETGYWMLLDALTVQFTPVTDSNVNGNIVPTTLNFGYIDSKPGGEQEGNKEGQILPHTASAVIEPDDASTLANSSSFSFTSVSSGSCYPCMLVEFQPTSDGPISTTTVAHDSFLAPWEIPLQGTGTHVERSLGSCTVLTYGTSCDYANLSSQNLSGLVLEDASFYDANLQKANLENADLRGAYLLSAQLQGAILQGANLQGANLYEALLDNANMQYAKLAGATLPTNLPDTIEWTILILPLNSPPTAPSGLSAYNDVPYNPVQACELKPIGADCDGLVIDQDLSGYMLRNATFRYALFGASGSLAGADLTGADFSRAIFAQSFNFQGATLANSKFEDTSLSSDNFTGANLSGASFSWSSYSKANYVISFAETLVKEGLTVGGAINLATNVSSIIKYLDFGGGTVVRALLSSNPNTTINVPTDAANVIDCDDPMTGHQGSPACNAYPENSNVSMANATLTQAQFSGVSMSCTNFSGANLTSANLSGSDNFFNGSNFSGATLTNADLDSAQFDEGQCSSYGALQPTTFANANASGVNLSYAQLDLATLNGANLTGANLQYANISSVDLANVNLTNVNISHAAVGGSNWYMSTTVTGLQLPTRAPIAADVPGTVAGASGCILFNDYIRAGWDSVTNTPESHATLCGIAE